MSDMTPADIEAADRVLDRLARMTPEEAAASQAEADAIWEAAASEVGQLAGDPHQDGYASDPE